MSLFCKPIQDGIASLTSMPMETVPGILETGAVQDIGAAARARLASVDRTDLEFPDREPITAEPFCSGDQR